MKTLPLAERLDTMRLGANLDTVNFGLLKEQIDRVQKSGENKAKALSVLERKVDYALRPIEKQQNFKKIAAAQKQ